MIEEEQKKTLDFDTLIQRAFASDENRKFAIATNYYFTIISRHYSKLISNQKLFDEIVTTFIYDIILLPVGVQRERMLSFLLKNENLNIFEYKTFLEKISNYQLIQERELDEFLKKCPEKLRILTAKENNYFERSIFFHNLFSLSKVYENISFDSLTRFLQMDIDKILSYTFKLILENKLNAKIDESNQFIIFEAEPTDSLTFDKQIQNYCLKVLQLSDYVKSVIS